MNAKYSGFVGVLLLGACSTDTGPVQIGQDTYLISKQGWIGSEAVGKVKAEAFAEAGKFCSAQGRAIQPVRTEDRPGQLGARFPESEVQFRCLTTDDPDLHRPTQRPDPNVIIENR